MTNDPASDIAVTVVAALTQPFSIRPDSETLRQKRMSKMVSLLRQLAAKVHAVRALLVCVLMHSTGASRTNLT
jgi:hypothetical protein